MKYGFIKILAIALIALMSEFSALAQKNVQVLYKTIDSVDLYVDVYYPQNLDTNSCYPSIVFFFGGGWRAGDRKQFQPQAEYFSGRGAVCFLPDYRIKWKNGTTPVEALKDAKSVIRFFKERAGVFHIDTTKIVASGGSAGGHLAAATALIKKFNETNENSSISCIPNALALFNPVIDNGPGGYGYDRIGVDYKDFSPLHNIVKGAPPTIIFLGTEDKLIPVETAKYYAKVMERVGSRCDLFLYEGQEHGFFKFKEEYLKKTLLEMDRFLVSLGYLHGEPNIKLE